MGLLIVYITLIRGRNRDFDFWFPGPRVLAEIAEVLDSNDVKTNCLLECHQIFPSDLKKFWQEANVDFSKSVVKKFPKTYFASMDFGEVQVEIEFELDKKNAIIRGIRSSADRQNCNCED